MTATMTFDEFTRLALQYALDNPDQRVGQAYFNYLYAVRPELADAIRGTLIDPFHRNDQVPNAQNFVRENWSEEKK